MLEEPKAFLAFPSLDEVSSALAKRIADVARAHGFDVLEPWHMGPRSELAGQIWRAIRSADVVIADLTGTNANVVFEVGLAFGLGKRVFLMSRKGGDGLPFDLQGFQVAVYQPDELDHVGRYIDLWLRDEAKERLAASR